MHTTRICTCGSGYPSYGIYDARNIFCTFACERCEAEKKAHYRAEIFEDPNYECTEQIEED